MPDHRSLLTRISLRTRIIGLVTSLVIAITLLLSWVASREAALQLEENIGYRSADTAYQMVDKLSRSMDARIKEVRLLLGIKEFADRTDPSSVRAQLEHLQRNYDVPSWIGVTDGSGTVIASTGGLLEGSSIAQRPVFIEGRQALWVGDVHDDAIPATPQPHGRAHSVRRYRRSAYRFEGHLYWCARRPSQLGVGKTGETLDAFTATAGPANRTTAALLARHGDSWTH